MEKIEFEEQGIRIIYPADCGNAPKKRVLVDLIKAFAVKDIHLINDFTAEKIKWEIVNDITVQGQERLIEVLENKLTSKISEIEIFNNITHGKTASVNGIVKFEDKRITAFCNVYAFVSAGKNTIKEITSYVINLDENN